MNRTDTILLLQNCTTLISTLSLRLPLQRFIFWSFFLITASFNAQSQSNSGQKVYFSGIAYLGDFALLSQNYEHALRLNATSRKSVVGKLDSALSKRIASHPPKNFSLEYGLANLKSANTVVMSIALEKERVSQEKVGRITKLIAEVSGQALFFDFKSMTLVANYPIEIALNHTINSVTVTQQDIQKLFDKLYFGSDEQAGFINHAVNIMANLQPNYSQGLRFQVASVSFSDKARQFLPDDLPPQRLSQYIGQYFSARLAKTKGLTVLPFTKGFAIGNQMSGRFANGDVFTLTLPDADYTFELSVLDFKKAPYKKNQVYAARLGLKLKEPLLKKTYVDGAFHYAVPKLVLAQNSAVDDWPAFEDALEVLMDDLVEQLSQPSKSWFKSHTSDPSVYKQFRNKEGLFND